MRPTDDNIGSVKSPSLKRRKIRKGTQSCWECKRRKTRCTFRSQTDSVCDGCRSRCLTCIGQDFHDEIGSRHGGDVSQRNKQTITGHQPTADNDAGLNDSRYRKWHDSNVRMRKEDEREQSSAASNTKRPTNSARYITNLAAESKTGYEDLYQALVAVWPSQEEFDILMSVEVQTSVLLHGIICAPYSKVLGNKNLSLREMLQIPQIGSHPAQVARVLLLLSSFLQSIPKGKARELGQLSQIYRDTMLRTFEAACRLVTRHDSLVSSVEGIECLMIESMYHNNAGDLSQAWLTNRRAMNMAQLLGLHAKPSLSSCMLDPNTLERIEPECMWFRIVTSDRYLSLILGLPQGAPASDFATSAALSNCDSLERIERIQALVGGMILDRTKDDSHNFEHASKIDRYLQDAANSMPAQWWLSPDLTKLTEPNLDSLQPIMRMMSHFAYYHLLTRLYLPFILQAAGTPQYEYSRSTVTYASREILTRFVSFRRLEEVVVYCRGIDYLAFIASTTLCLAHIDAGKRYASQINNESPPFHYLTHQRPGDRALMECMLQTMTKMANHDGDQIASAIVSVLDRLLAIEEAATKKCCYHAEFVTGESERQEETESTGKSKLDGILSIEIPHFGIIRIVHAAGTDNGPPGTCHCAIPSSLTKELDVSLKFPAKFANLSPRANCQPSEIPSCPIVRSSSRSNETCDDAPQRTHPEGEIAIEQSQGPFNASYQNDHFNDELSLPGFMAPDHGLSLDQWTLHGVDIALFDNLFEGVEAWL